VTDKIVAALDAAIAAVKAAKQPENKPAKEPTYRMVAEGAVFGLKLGGDKR
jgi:hypothetical protein